jgi:hypothetical protein
MMKLLLAILAIVLVAASLYADYKWRQWIAARKPQRHGPVVGDPARRRDHNNQP